MAINNSDSASLHLCNLTIRTNTKTLVDNVDLTLVKGQVTGLVGASGCGKSLTCQSLLGLTPTELQISGTLGCGGEILDLGERRLVSQSCRLPKATLAMILQNPSSCFNPLQRIRSHFRETGKAHGLNSKENCPVFWSRTLMDVGIEDPERVLRLFPFQMSGGMLQRVMIALALMVKADFLIADEATTDLDPVVQAQILNLLERLIRERGLGVLLVTHDLAVIARLAQNLAVMYSGRIVERGQVDKLFSAPGHVYTKALVDAHFRLYRFDEATVG